MDDIFTPEQIAQILEEFFKVVGTRRYVGERYVPIFGRKGEESIQWDNSAPYEPLTIVLYQGNSYTSRQYVPIGVDITNQEFWAITGNYNAQTESAITTANNAQNDIDTLLPKADFSAENTVKKYIDESPTRFPTMSTTTKGIAKVGAGLAMNGDAVELDGNGDIATAVTSWLNAHPEATTTVQDGSITTPKLADGAVTDAKLADGAVTDAKLAQNVMKSINVVGELTQEVRGAVHPNMTVGRYINLNGQNVAGGNTLALSDMVAIPPACFQIDAHIGVYRQLFYWIAFYDESGAFISGVAEGVQGSQYASTTDIPANAAYIRLTNISAGTTTATPVDEVTYTFKTVKRIGAIEENIDTLNALCVANAPDWSSKKWCVIGDSITEDNFRASEHYWSYISDVTGIEVANQGISGSGYLMYRPIVNRITADGFPTDCDVITMMAGVNDVAWETEYPIGDVTDTGTSTLCGALNAAIDALEAKYPTFLPLGIVTPTPACIQSDAFSNVVYPDQYPAVANCKLGQFVDKMKEIAERRGYPCLDLFHESGLQPQVASVRQALFKAGSNYAADGLHPNAAGHKTFYGKYLEFLKSVIQ